MKLSRTLETLAATTNRGHIVVFHTVVFDGLDQVHYAERARLLYNLIVGV